MGATAAHLVLGFTDDGEITLHAMAVQGVRALGTFDDVRDAWAAIDRMDATMFEELLTGFDPIDWRQIAAWSKRLDLSVDDVLLLVAASMRDRPSRAVDLARVSGLSLVATYLAVHKLRCRGYMHAEHRHYALTAVGHLLVSSLESAHMRRIEEYLHERDRCKRQRLCDALGTKGR